MKYLHCLLLWQAASTAAFTVVTRQTRSSSNNIKQRVLFSSAPEDDEIKATSFQDAGNSIIDAQDKERMEAMGDFDSNPDSTADSMEKMREAIKARTAELGIEKSVATQQYIEEAKARAIEARQNRQQPGQLDLSQISTGNEPGSKKSDWDENLPNMMYDPADDLTDEEQKEADPVGQMSIVDQVMTEVKESKWPDFGTVIREVVLLFVVVAITGGVIINFDVFLRNTYTGLGMIPRMEDIPGQLEDLDLPEGFTNNMNEDDLAKITEEMNKAAKDAGVSSESVKVLLDSSNPDL